MNVSKYDFHDGYIIDLKKISDNIEMFMESSEINIDDLEGDMVLSDHNTLKGGLNLSGIVSVKVNGAPCSLLVKDYDEGNIFSFKITADKVLLDINWINIPPKMRPG